MNGGEEGMPELLNWLLFNLLRTDSWKGGDSLGFDFGVSGKDCFCFSRSFCLWSSFNWLVACWTACWTWDCRNAADAWAAPGCSSKKFCNCCCMVCCWCWRAICSVCKSFDACGTWRPIVVFRMSCWGVARGVTDSGAVIAVWWTSWFWSKAFWVFKADSWNKNMPFTLGLIFNYNNLFFTPTWFKDIWPACKAAKACWTLEMTEVTVGGDLFRFFGSTSPGLEPLVDPPQVRGDDSRSNGEAINWLFWFSQPPESPPRDSDSISSIMRASWLASLPILLTSKLSFYPHVFCRKDKLHH